MPNDKKLAKFTTSSPEETFQLGQKLATTIHRPSIVAFFGDLGAGKTTLIRGYASTRAALSPEEISSPTFQLLHIYDNTQTQSPLYHFDLWRLSNTSDFVQAGFDEFLEPGHDVCIEWSERIESLLDALLPKKVVRVYITHLDETKREITIVTTS